MSESTYLTPFEQVSPDEDESGIEQAPGIATSRDCEGAGRDEGAEPIVLQDEPSASPTPLPDDGAALSREVIHGVGHAHHETITQTLYAPADEAAQVPSDLAEEPESPVVPLLAIQEPAIPHGPRPGAGGWTIASLCLGIAIIASCILIPQADANRELAWEHQRLRADLDQIQKQIAVNDEFLQRVAHDPSLAERLAQRQMQFIREGTSVLALEGAAPATSSPFLLVNVPPPPEFPAFSPPGGPIAALVRQPRTRTWMMGLGLMLMALGLVLGYGVKRQGASD